VEAAEAVADTILVTPALVRGEGKVTIRLKPTVLDGSEIHLEAKGTKITVAIAPATNAAQQIVEQSKAQLAQTLAQRLPSFQFAVMISPRPMAYRKGSSDETT
jgi:flagellar hook-length control protein FliK